MSFSLNSSQLSTWRTQFFDSPINQLAQNICTISDPICAGLHHNQKELIPPKKEHHELSQYAAASVGGPNWICMGLDLLRMGMPKDSELSVSYLYYWHKLERCNYFLNAVVELLARCEPLDGRTFRYLMKHAVPDAGNWQMFVNLVQKYGVIPKECYLASWSSTHTLHLNKMLISKLHEYSCRLHAEFTLDQDNKALFALIETMMEELYKIINICLGTPPTIFNWNFKAEDKQLNLTPLAFYQLVVASHYSIDKQICLGHDPRLSSKYQYNYRIAHSSNMVNGLHQCYNNQPMDILLNIIKDSLVAGSAVWLACDLQATFYGKAEVLSLKTHNFEHVFGMPVGTSLNKAERMLYKATRRNKVLLLTGVTLDEMQQPLQFITKHTAAEATKTSTSDKSLSKPATEDKKDALKRKGAGKGKATLLNVDWLREYAFEIVVDSRFVPSGILHALHTQRTIELPVWDTMGALLT